VQIRALEVAAEARTEARIALCAAGLAVVLVGGLLATRSGLPTDLDAVALAFTIGLWPILGPAALRNCLKGYGVGTVVGGMLTVVLLLLPFAVVMLGLSGQILVYTGALWFVRTTWQRAHVRSARRGACALALVVVSAVLLVLQIGGTKYVNFFADQLALFGRTDGDVFGHGAITNSLRYIGLPSMGIDGIQQLHYHVGVNALTAALASAGDLDATFAIVLVKALVLAPLLARIAASASFDFCSALEARQVTTLRVLGWVLGIVILLPLSNVGNMRLASESMLLGGILLLCAAPSLLAHWVQAEPANKVCWVFWLAMIPLITVSKVSAGAIWFGLIGYTALRTFGLRRVQTWAIGGVALILFGAMFRLTSDPTGMGAHWFGRPYYVERAFDTGDYLLPVRVQIEWIGALICLWMLAHRGQGQAARRLLELTLVVAVGANLPGLLMEISGGDAYYFITISNWIVLPVLIASGAMLFNGTKEALRVRLWAGRAVIMALLIAVVWLAVPEVKLGLRHFIASNALLRTGDLSFYDNDNRKPVREDAERAWQTVDHRTLLTGPRAGAPAEGLLARLAELRREKGNVLALYTEPDVADYWNYLRDCDLSAAFPMAMVGVQMIDGYNPDQSVCAQEISRRGYPDVPQWRTSKSDADLCALAQERHIKEIYVVESLTDRTGDRLLACGE
jgi:hypothetical protein